MTAKYYALLTNLGAAKLANATALGTQLSLTQMAVGDGGGVLPTPDPAQTKLIGEKRRAALNSLSVDPANTNQIIAEQIIPEDQGGFWIREIGLFDQDNTLIAIANCPETYKPQLQEGSGRTQTVRMILVVNSTEAVTLKIDPSVVLATRKYVDDKVIEVKAYADDLMAKHVAAANPHSQYLQIANALKEIKDKNLVAKVLENLSLGEAAKRGVGTGANQIPDMSMQGFGSNWVKTVGGLIIQRGTFGYPIGINLMNVNFPTAFVSSATVNLTWADATIGGPVRDLNMSYGIIAGSQTKTGFQAWMSGSGGFNLNYIAIGY
ncbi:phage tail protein [Rahnella sp. FC061912-K]|uniref:phage tail protein n=1 Tax=Rahnella rivi TaxID=2816249 RepID=UPI0006F6EDB7|nr:phage tail protein [Rahnella rivi]KQN65004.1 phage tail protein [Serratia sp. Leaf51]MBU9828407.1 phage tail protein [Rahnella rivi]